MIVPVGGIDKIPTFLALLRAHLDVAAVIDGKSGGNQRINSMIAKGVISGDRVVPLAEVMEVSEADIEDLFEVDFYLGLVKDSGVAPVKKGDLGREPRIVQQIEAHLGSRV